MRIDGHPWEHAPSGSTTHPSRQQAGAVASNKAFRMKSSRVSGVNPSLAKASAAVMRYGFCFVVFIWFDRTLIARRTPQAFPWSLPEDHTPEKCTAPFPWGGIHTFSNPPRAPLQRRHTEQGVPNASEAHRLSLAWASEPTRKVLQPIDRAITSSATESTEAIKRVFHP